MADRQGLLRGFHVSEVQAWASNIVVQCEEGDRAHVEDLAARQRLYASGRYEWAELFGGGPQGEAQTAEDVEESTTQQGDAISTRYVLDEAASEVNPDDAEAMLAELLSGSTSGSFSGDELTVPGEWM